MIEKYQTEVIIKVYRDDDEELKSMIEEIKAYSKTYEYDKVTVIDLTKSNACFMNTGQYTLILQIERDTNNLGRKYEYEEEKLFGFYEDEES